jgi:hypothetical protein
MHVPSVSPSCDAHCGASVEQRDAAAHVDGRAVTLCKPHFVCAPPPGTPRALLQRIHAGGIKLSGTSLCGKGPGKRRFCCLIRLWATTDRTNVLKWEIAEREVIKLHSITPLSIYFFEENNFVAFPTLSHCSENEKPLTPANLPLYSDVGW